jgi:hypothetical protein
MGDPAYTRAVYDKERGTYVSVEAACRDVNALHALRILLAGE